MPGSLEAPLRVRDSVAHLQTSSLPIDWVEGEPAAPEALLLAHEPEHLDHLEDTAGIFHS